MSNTITMYSTGACPYCVQAENFLTRKGASVTKIRVDQSEVAREKLISLTGKRTVPQLFIGDTYVGGFDNLMALEQQGKLNALLAG